MELSRCIGLSSPGPHCFLLVMDSTRFTSEEENCINQFADMFGNNFFQYVIVVFTRKDDLDRENKTIREYLGEAKDNLKNLIKKCSNRYIAFNNMDGCPSGEKQARDLLEMITDIIRNNKGSFYTNEMFALAEKHIQKREKEIAEMRNREMKDEIEKTEKELSKKNLSPEEKDRERIEKLNQIADKYAKLPHPRHEVRNDISGDGGFFLGVLIGVLGTLSIIGYFVIKLAITLK